MSAIFSGDPTEDMEIAKSLIAKYPNLDLAPIVAIASDRMRPESARVAAVYTLGFTDDNGMSLVVLRGILRDSGASESLKEHAAEAMKSIAGVDPC